MQSVARAVREGLAHTLPPAAKGSPTAYARCALASHMFGLCLANPSDEVDVGAGVIRITKEDGRCSTANGHFVHMHMYNLYTLHSNAFRISRPSVGLPPAGSIERFPFLSPSFLLYRF